MWRVNRASRDVGNFMSFPKLGIRPYTHQFQLIWIAKLLWVLY